MPLVQIIPYVADQFDPGIYVFAGGTFDSGVINTEVPTERAFHVVSEQTFNVHDLTHGNFSHVGIHVFGQKTFRKRSIIQGRAVIYLTGVDWQIDLTHEHQKFIVPEEVTWNIQLANYEDDSTEFSKTVEGQVQNQVGQPASVPHFANSDSSLTRIEMPETPTVLNTDIKRIRAAQLASSISIQDVGNTFISWGHTKISATDSSVQAGTKPMFATQSQTSNIDNKDIVAVIVLGTVNNESRSNNLEFTM